MLIWLEWHPRVKLCGHQIKGKHFDQIQMMEKPNNKSINKSHENQSLRKKINMKEPTYMLFVVSLLRKHIGK